MVSSFEGLWGLGPRACCLKLLRNFWLRWFADSTVKYVALEHVRRAKGGRIQGARTRRTQEFRAVEV